MQTQVRNAGSIAGPPRRTAAEGAFAASPGKSQIRKCFPIRNAANDPRRDGRGQSGKRDRAGDQLNSKANPIFATRCVYLL